MRILYMDTLFFLNYGLDYLALYFAGKLMKLPGKQWRLLLAALPGAIFAVVSVLWLEESFWYYPGFVLFGALMVWLGYGSGIGKTKLLLCAVAELGGAVLLGGAISALYCALDGWITPEGQRPMGKGEWIMVLAMISGGVLRIAFSVLDRRGAGRRVYVTVSALRKKVRFLLYVDSGNLLRDPIDGKSVVILSRRAVSRLPWAVKQSLERGIPSRGMEKRMRVIPTCSVGGDRILYGFLPDEVADENGKRLDVVVAMGEGSFCGGNDGIVSADAVL